jgi:hypothetical protein
MRQITGDVGENRDRLLTFIEGQGIVEPQQHRRTGASNPLLLTEGAI